MSNTEVSRPLPPAPDPQGGELPNSPGPWWDRYGILWLIDIQANTMHEVNTRGYIEAGLPLTRATVGGWVMAKAPASPAPAASPPPAAAVTGELPSGPGVETITPWPDNWPAYHNGCSDPCDAIVGPCVCGAWHKPGDFVVTLHPRVPAQPQAEASEELAWLERPVESSANCPKCGRHNYHYDARSQRNICPWFDCLHTGPKCATELDLARQQLSALTSRAESAEAERDRLKEKLAGSEGECERECPCPECDQGKLRNEIVPNFVTRVLGIELTIQEAHIRKCDKCGAKYYSSGEIRRWEHKALRVQLTAAEARAEQLAEALGKVWRATNTPDHKRNDTEWLRAATSIAYSFADAALAPPAPTTDAKGA